MQRIAFVIALRPGQEEEYRRRHAEIWPEMLDALRSVGARNYSIFLHNHQLFAYLETDDFDRLASGLARNPVNARWQEYMRDLISLDIDPATGFPGLLPMMFHMD